MIYNPAITDELKAKFGDDVITPQKTADDITTLWVSEEKAGDILRHLKEETERPFRVLYDLTAVDERIREGRTGLPESDFTVVYHLLSFDRNEDIRIKVPLKGEYPK